MANKVSFSEQHGSLEDIEEFYVDSENALNYYYEPSNAGIIPKFIGYTKEEIGNESHEKNRSTECVRLKF